MKKSKQFSAASRSIAIYGFYLAANGIGLLTLPNVVLGLLGLPGEGGVWVRLFGMAAAEIGLYCVYSELKGIQEFYSATVFGRIFAAIVFLALVGFRLGPPQLIILATVDLLTALWTSLAIRQDNRKSA